MDRSERHFGAVAEMSRLYRRLPCGWKRDRNLAIDRNLSADGISNSVRGIVVVFCSEEWAEVSGAPGYLRPEVKKRPLAKSCQAPRDPPLPSTR